MKIRPVGPELLYVDKETDRQTDRQTDRYNEDNSRLNNSANAPKHMPVERTCFVDQCCFS
jgi:hypothetical protein